VVADQDAVQQNPEKDPHDWVTGDEPATGPQQSYLTTLAQQKGEQVEVEGLTKAEASERIDDLKGDDGR
jgi:Tfp pilus assembly protein PilN